MSARRAQWRPLLAIAAILVLGPRAQAQQARTDQCVVCHQELPDSTLASPVREYVADVHAEKGFGCVACHGGDASLAGPESMDPARGFIGKPSGRTVLEMCGRCHASAEIMRRYNPSLRVDQITEYRSSVHGRRLLQNGDTAVATCKSCHPAHRVLRPTDPRSSVHPHNVATTCGACHADPVRMRRYSIPTNQKDEYQQSVHWQMLDDGGDLSAPTCNDCHGNHGAAPPGVGSVGNVCGTCHALIAEKFRNSSHAPAFAAAGMPGCVACHGNHAVVRATNAFLGLDSAAVCGQCHEAGDVGGRAAVAMRQLMDSLDARFGEAQRLLGRAEHAGMQVSQALFELEGARNANVAARNAVHAAVLDSVAAHVTEGLAVSEAGVLAGRRALKELDFRRTGLAVSVVIIAALIAGLLLRIRQLEGHATTGTAPEVDHG